MNASIGKEGNCLETILIALEDSWRGFSTRQSNRIWPSRKYGGLLQQHREIKENLGSPDRHHLRRLGSRRHSPITRPDGIHTANFLNDTKLNHSDQENNLDTILAIAQRTFGAAYQFVPHVGYAWGQSAHGKESTAICTIQVPGNKPLCVWLSSVQ
jgi:hypothetical protein